MLNFPGKSMTKNNDEITTLSDDNHEPITLEEVAAIWIAYNAAAHKQWVQDLDDKLLFEAKKLEALKNEN